MSQKPKVSILVPIYGVEKFIERCAVSLFEQTFEDIEFIFINDCSPDKSMDVLNSVLSKYPARKKQVTIVENLQNLGIAANRNLAISLATGEYTLFVDSDDYIESDTIDLLYKKIISEGADVCLCDYYMEWESSRMIVSQDVSDNKEDFLKLVYSGQTQVCLWNKLIKRSLYVENDIKTINGINLGEDFLMVSKLLFFSKKIVKVNRPLYHYIKFNSSSHTSQISLNYVKDMEAIISAIENFILSKGASDKYYTSLLECKLRIKLEFILKIDPKYQNYIVKLFPESKSIESSIVLPFRDNLTLFILNLKSKKVVSCYLYVFKKMFNIYQKLKKR